VIFHLIVVTGLGCVASGASAFKGVNVKPSDLTLLKVGIIILLLSWVVLCLWSLFSLLPGQRTVDALGFVGGTKVCAIIACHHEYMLTFDSDLIRCAILPSLRRYPNDVWCRFDPRSFEKSQSYKRCDRL
jgi:hypothetical protein